MKTLVTILLFMLIVPGAFCQTNLGTIDIKPSNIPFKDSTWLKPKTHLKKALEMPGRNSLRDTIIYLPKKQVPYDNMPNAFIQKNQPDVYVGNNGKGLDIYRAQIDNMPIVKPDKSFNSVMPGLNYQLLPDTPGKPEQLRIYRSPKK